MSYSQEHISLDGPMTEGTARLLLERLGEIKDLMGMNAKPLYSLKEAADILGVSPTTLRVYANEGKINAKKQDPENTRSTWVIPSKELERLKEIYGVKMKAA